MNGTSQVVNTELFKPRDDIPRDRQLPPHGRLERLPNQLWVTTTGAAIDFAMPVTFSLWKAGDEIIIPLIPYRMSPTPVGVAAFMAAYAAHVVDSLRTAGMRPLHVHTVTGLNVDVVDPTDARLGGRLFVGMAIWVEG